MAHFAELESKTDPTGFTSDTHLVVTRVVVVGNDIAAGGGTLGDNDMHVDGETWCVNFFKGGNWKQTSYNHSFRKQYCHYGAQPRVDRAMERSMVCSLKHTSCQAAILGYVNPSMGDTGLVDKLLFTLFKGTYKTKSFTNCGAQPRGGTRS